MQLSVVQLVSPCNEKKCGQLTPYCVFVLHPLCEADHFSLFIYSCITC